MLKLPDLKILRKYPFFWHWVVNILVASIWGYYAYKGLMNLNKATYFELNIAMLFRNTSLTLLFLLRRPSRLTSQRLGDWFVAIAGTFITYLYVTRGNKPIFPSLVPTGYFVMVTAAFLSAIAVVSLGRSFGIVPANRGIKTKGLYAFVRHPIYSLYMLHDIAWNLNCFSGHNVCVFLLYCLLTYGRAKCEERLLRKDSAYQEYALKTRYMFLPGII